MLNQAQIASHLPIFTINKGSDIAARLFKRFVSRTLAMTQASLDFGRVAFYSTIFFRRTLIVAAGGGTLIGPSTKLAGLSDRYSIS